MKKGCAHERVKDRHINTGTLLMKRHLFVDGTDGSQAGEETSSASESGEC